MLANYFLEHLAANKSLSINDNYNILNHLSISSVLLYHLTKYVFQRLENIRTDKIENPL